MTTMGKWWTSVGIKIKQTTDKTFKKPHKVNPYFPGVALGDLLDYLTELQANGVPDTACISVDALYAKADWTEER